MTDTAFAAQVVIRLTVFKDEHDWYAVDCCSAEGEPTPDVLVIAGDMDVSNTTRFGDLAKQGVALTGRHCSATCSSGELECSANSLTITLRFCASADGWTFLMLVTFTVCVPDVVCGAVCATVTAWCTDTSQFASFACVLDILSVVTQLAQLLDWYIWPVDGNTVMLLSHETGRLSSEADVGNLLMDASGLNTDVS